ncbi:MAG: hypothetical protein VYE22_40570 [Myxococcota bacterium]|nr:hypothetical protein [Myxococcota bacterium]
MRFVSSVLLAALLGAASLARAQDDGPLVVPPPPPPAEAPAEAPPADAPPPASPAGTLGLDSPVAPPASSPLEDTLAPLLFAAETDLAAGRLTLAHARATVVARALPPGAPLRIRAEGLLIRVEPSLPVGVAAPSIEEVFSPLVAQAELDLRAGQPAFAAPRLDFALRALPPGPLRQRAEQLRASVGGAPAPTAPPYGYATAPPQRPARDPSLAGGGEWAELYITSSAFGAVTGAWLTHVASDGTASSSTYVVASVAGGGLMAVGVLGLHLSNALRTGVPPTISSSIRFGFANGALVVGLAALQGGIDDVGAFSLIWGGGAVGLATGLAVGLGLEPSVAEERFVESLGIWLGGLSTFAAMMTDYADPTAGLALSLVGLDAGILLGLGLVAAGQTLPRRRTMFLDLGFVAGGGAGAGLVLLGYYVDQFRGGADVWAFGIGAAAGAIAGWTLLWFLTEGMTDDPTPEPPPVRLGLGPIEGGGAVTLYGTL